MTPLKFHLARAVYDWTVSNSLTPHVIVDAGAADVRIPTSYVENDRIVLNVHPRAVHDFSFDETAIRFTARFSGHSVAVEIPLAALLAVYAKENGQGVSFPERDDPPEQPTGISRGSTSAPRKGPVLRRIK